MVNWYTIILALSMLAIAWFFGRTLRGYRKDSETYRIRRSKRLDTVRSTYFLDVGECDSMCGICFGEYEDYTLYECNCGRTFHIECAELTKQCPYCGSGPDSMTMRPVKRAICPVCGKAVRDNVCSCGTVLPNKDRTFKCACGAPMLLNESECRKCGALYAPKYRVNKR